MNINSLNTNNVQGLMNFYPERNDTKNINNSEEIYQNNIQDNISISLDSEAQKLLAAVGNDLQESSESLSSVHQGLDYSRVMQLLEGL